MRHIKMIERNDSQTGEIPLQSAPGIVARLAPRCNLAAPGNIRFRRENCMQFRSKNVTGRENRPWVSLTIAHGYMCL